MCSSLHQWINLFRQLWVALSHVLKLYSHMPELYSEQSFTFSLQLLMFYLLSDFFCEKYDSLYVRSLFYFEHKLCKLPIELKLQHFWGFSELQRSTILLMHNLWQQFLSLFQPYDWDKSMPKCFSGARRLCSSEWNSWVMFSRMSSLFKSSKQLHKLFNFDLPSKPMSQLLSTPILSKSNSSSCKYY